MRLPNALRSCLLAGLVLASALLHAAPTTSLAYARLEGQLCNPTLPCAAPFGFDQSSEAASWHGGGLAPALAIDSGTFLFGDVRGLAAGSLATGAMHVAASALGLTPGARAYGLAEIKLADTLEVRNPDGTPYTGTEPTNVRLEITGSFGASDGSGLFAGIYAAVYAPGYIEDFIGGLHGRVPLRQSELYWFEPPAGPLPSTLDLSFDIDGPFELVLGVWASFSFTQNAAASEWFDFDLGHTVRAEVITPAGTQFWSASGLFPGSVDSQAIPVPGSLLNCAAALSLLAWQRRRRPVC